MKIRFIHRFVVFIAYFLAFLMIPMASAGAVKYTVTDLGTLGGASSSGYGINNAGQIVGSSISSAGDTRAFLWSSGTGMEDIVPGDGTYPYFISSAYDINENGQVAGFYSPSGSGVAFIWSHDQGVQTLDPLPPVSASLVSIAYAINDLEQIVGYADWFYVAKSFLWIDSTGLEAIDVGDGGYEGCCFSFSTAFDINNLDEVIGECMNDCIDNQNELYNGAYLWTSNEGPQHLGTLGGDGYGDGAAAINEASQVVGGSYTTSAALHAFLWTRSAGMQDLGHLGGDQSVAYGINEAGQVVGYGTTGSGSSRAFVWTSSAGMKDLNNLIDSGDPLAGRIELSEAQDINDSGQIVANGTLTATGEARAFLLTPVETAQEVIVSLQGLALNRASCDNLTTGQKVLVSVQPGATSADCSEAGMSVDAGDKVGVRLQGTVPFNSRSVKATANGFSLQSAVCENQRTQQKVTVHLKPGTKVADCTAAGLRIRPRDLVGIRLVGSVAGS